MKVNNEKKPELQISEETFRKYRRVQEFYKAVKAYNCFSHNFCEELARQFFHFRGATTINRILTEEIPEGITYQHTELDKIWIRAYIQTHIKLTENA